MRNLVFKGVSVALEEISWTPFNGSKSWSRGNVRSSVTACKVSIHVLTAVICSCRKQMKLWTTTNSTKLWPFNILYLNPKLICFSYLFRCCIPDRWRFLFDPSWLQSSWRPVSWRSAAGPAGGSSGSWSGCGPLLAIEIFLLSKVLGPPPGPGPILGCPGCAQALGLSLHNQLQSPPPGLLQPESPQSAPVKTGVERWRWV